MCSGLSWFLELPSSLYLKLKKARAKESQPQDVRQKNSVQRLPLPHPNVRLYVHDQMRCYGICCALEKLGTSTSLAFSFPFSSLLYLKSHMRALSCRTRFTDGSVFESRVTLNLNPVWQIL